jgi:hypothetical protein
MLNALARATQRKAIRPVAWAARLVGGKWLTRQKKRPPGRPDGLSRN